MPRARRSRVPGRVWVCAAAKPWPPDRPEEPELGVGELWVLPTKSSRRFADQLNPLKSALFVVRLWRGPVCPFAQFKLDKDTCGKRWGSVRAALRSLNRFLCPPYNQSQAAALEPVQG